MRRKFLWISVVFVLTALLLAQNSRASIILFGDVADAERNGSGILQNQTATALRVGTAGPANAANRRNALFVFDLQTITAPFATATLDLYYLQKVGNPSPNGDLYGVGFSSLATSFPATADFNNTPTDANAAKILDNYVTPSTLSGSYLGASNTALVDYLNTRPSGSAGNFVFFRVSQDGMVGASRGYNFSAAEASGTSQDPRLTVDVVTANPSAIPEPISFVVWSLLFCIGLMVRKKRLSRHP